MARSMNVSPAVSVEPVAAVDGLRVEVPTSGVRQLVLDRPGYVNALDRALAARIAAELELAAADPDLRALIVTGAGGAFSAGADLGMIDLRGRDRTEVLALMREVMRFGGLMRALPMPTIAAIEGPVVGGALALALGCDIRLAAPDATFLSPFVHMGLVPDCGESWLIPRMIGDGPALEFMLTGTSITAADAARLGLVTRISDSPATDAVELSATIARRPATAVRATKRLVRESLVGEISEAIEREAIAQTDAFLGPEFAATYEAWRTTRRPT
jgi:enoyl-CoA hydratase/carnithine racemase